MVLIRLLVFVSAVLSVLSPAYGHLDRLVFWTWDGDDPLPGGWTGNGVGKYSATGNYKGGASFTANENWLMSPRFDEPIRSVIMEIATSNPDVLRWLALVPMTGGSETGTGLECQSTSNQSYQVQTFDLQGMRADQFVLRFIRTGISGNWAIKSIVVYYGDESTDEALRFWKVSGFDRKSHSRVADFSVLRLVTSDAFNAWWNGETVDGFHAFSKNGPCDRIRVYNDKSTNSGLYAMKTGDDEDSPIALSLRGADGISVRLVLPIGLDVNRQFESFVVSYEVWSSGDQNAVKLSFGYAVAEDQEPLESSALTWIPVDEADSCGTSEDRKRSVSLPVTDLGGKAYVYLRWSVPAGSKSPALGITNVRVTAYPERRGTMMFIR